MTDQQIPTLLQRKMLQMLVLWISKARNPLQKLELMFVSRVLNGLQILPIIRDRLFCTRECTTKTKLIIQILSPRKPEDFIIESKTTADGAQADFNPEVFSPSDKFFFETDDALSQEFLDMQRAKESPFSTMSGYLLPNLSSMYCPLVLKVKLMHKLRLNQQVLMVWMQRFLYLPMQMVKLLACVLMTLENIFSPIMQIWPIDRFQRLLKLQKLYWQMANLLRLR